MNSTPNYHFKDHIKLCADDAIDRELRRVEDKVDASAAAILDRYTKAEIDCLLRKCKSGSCGPSPSSCDCDSELEKLWQALRARYSNEEIDRLILGYIREHDGDPDAHPAIWEELRKLYLELSNKASIKPYEKIPLPLADEDISYHRDSYYYKTCFGEVHINMSLTKTDGNFVREEVVAVLPEGYRPASLLELPAVYGMHQNKKNAGTCYIRPDGTIQLMGVPDASGDSKTLYFSTTFLVGGEEG